MRPPRLILVLFCLTFFPILLTLFSFLFSSHRVATPNSLAGRTSGLRALFSFNIPSSLFPPSAIISLTDDNSTFFLARPAAFGPLLPAKGLSGQLWVGSGFGDGGGTAGVDGELGCSDIPGWGEGNPPRKQDKATTGMDNGKIVTGVIGGSPASHNRRRSDSRQEPKSWNNRNDASMNDGTDDHLHHPLPESESPGQSASDKRGERNPNRSPAHADIQSLQESAEIAGKVVLLSRGGCGFLEKVKWAQRRGGIALIVGDDTRGGSLVTMYAKGDTSNVTIPAIFTSYTTAHLLSSLVPPQIEQEASLSGGYKPSHTQPASSGGPGSGPMKTPSTVPTPTSTGNSVSTSKSGLFHSFFSFLGLGYGDGRPFHLEDSRRPPSSGNVDWVLMDNWDEQLASPGNSKASSEQSRSRVKTDNTRNGAGETKSDDDGFVIGVQDWRDPDLVAPKDSPLPKPNGASGKEDPKSQEGDKISGSTPDSDNGWFSSRFGWSKTVKSASGRQSSSVEQEASKSEKSPPISTPQSRDNINTNAHTGLWVTLSPTSMSTSPFFDTLLVLVVSPLLTLSVVYGLLLLRSRIRRRRWRAPKSVVDRLPVRTYHTITTSSSTTSSLRSSSPGSSSPTDPLLGSGSRSGSSRPRPRSRTTSGVVSGSSEPSKETAPFNGEMSGSGSTLWRRKYTGRQVECVVCLEEYVDGQSRVMSLPCGHEFHAECITPWLTTRRRTCPICKGDVVRSMSQYRESRSRAEQATDDTLSHDLESHNNASSAPLPTSTLNENGSGDLERQVNSDAGLLEGQASSAPQSAWRNFASLGFSVLNGDTIWHQSRDRNR